MSTELFARELQTEPLKMLADLVKLYCLTYGYSGAEAVKAIKRDAQALSDLASGKTR